MEDRIARCAERGDVFAGAVVVVERDGREAVEGGAEDVLGGDVGAGPVVGYCEAGVVGVDDLVGGRGLGVGCCVG